MIENLQRLNVLVGQRFDKRMATQAEADFKQLKVMSAKTKALSEYVKALIDEANEHTRKASEQIKAML